MKPILVFSAMLLIASPALAEKEPDVGRMLLSGEGGHLASPGTDATSGQEYTTIAATQVELENVLRARLSGVIGDKQNTPDHWEIQLLGIRWAPAVQGPYLGLILGAVYPFEAPAKDGFSFDMVRYGLGGAIGTRKPGLDFDLEYISMTPSKDTEQAIDGIDYVIDTAAWSRAMARLRLHLLDTLHLTGILGMYRFEDALMSSSMFSHSIHHDPVAFLRTEVGISIGAITVYGAVQKALNGIDYDDIYRIMGQRTIDYAQNSVLAGIEVDLR